MIGQATGEYRGFCDGELEWTTGDSVDDLYRIGKTTLRDEKESTGVSRIREVGSAARCWIMRVKAHEEQEHERERSERMRIEAKGEHVCSCKS